MSPWRETTWPFLASASLHGLLLASLVTWTFASNVPFGVERRGDPTVIDVVGPAKSAPAPSRAPVPHQAAAPAAAKPTAAPAPSAAAAPSEPAGFGLRDGTAGAGELGRPDGAAAGAKERYLYELRVLIEGRQTYPMASRRLKERGKVTVQFAVLRDGAIENVTVKNSSSFPRLDQAALELVTGLRKYKPLPEAIAGDRLLIELPIDYVLR